MSLPWPKQFVNGTFCDVLVTCNLKHRERNKMKQYLKSQG